MKKEFVITKYLSFEGSLGGAVLYLEKIEKQHSEEYSNLRLSFDDISSPYDESARFGYVLLGTREETEIETNIREKIEAADKERAEQCRRRTYEDLKKEFEK